MYRRRTLEAARADRGDIEDCVGREPGRRGVEVAAVGVFDGLPGQRDQVGEEWFTEYARSQRFRLAVDVDIAKAFVEPGAKVLEVGALPLLLNLALAREGFDTVGVDLDPSRFQNAIAEHGLDVVACNIETERFPFADATFDAITFNEVLEHLRINPVHCLRETHRVLKPGGKLMLETPNLRSLVGVRNLVVRGRSYAQANSVYDEFQKLERLGHMGHAREYATGDVEDLLQRVGFRVDELVFRQRQHGRLTELACRLFPPLRRAVSYIATAQASNPRPNPL
ncbi:MAG TPA: class I SAM-dependent methyltransferase [Solirubrobacteraceae bacterium]|nr:class I SAM-dependent methyltransferase [Solirubrobacteraceae bacterium]